MDIPYAMLLWKYCLFRPVWRFGVESRESDCTSHWLLSTLGEATRRSSEVSLSDLKILEDVSAQTICQV